MSQSRGWFNLEAAKNSALPDTSFFEGDSAFKFLGLTREQRLYGFIGCLIIGFVCSLLGSIALIIASISVFAALYGTGALISLLGTGFLLGFGKQVKMMFKPVRVGATLILFAAIALVFVGAFVLDNATLCIIFVVIQYLAYTWYSLSYIPYARSAVRKMFGLA